MDRKGPEWEAFCQNFYRENNDASTGMKGIIFDNRCIVSIPSQKDQVLRAAGTPDPLGGAFNLGGRLITSVVHPLIAAAGSSALPPSSGALRDRDSVASIPTKRARLNIPPRSPTNAGNQKIAGRIGSFPIDGDESSQGSNPIQVGHTYPVN